MNFQILIKLKDLTKNKTPTDMNNMQKNKTVCLCWRILSTLITYTVT